MLIRIFIFGLITIARGNQEATVLLLEHEGHTPYVAFDSATCASCPSKQVFGHSITGFVLDHNKILLSPVTTPNQNQLSYAGGRRDLTQTVPQDAGEAVDFSWVPAIPSMIRASGGTGKATEACLNSPKDCGYPLSAQMKLTLGTLQTCRLIETRGGIFADSIFGFDFKRNSASQSVLKQAMAAVVELVAPIRDDQPLTFTLTSFKDDAPRSVTLKSEPCVGMPGSRCIDIFLGNITKDDESDPLGDFEALHFAEFFGVLSEKEKPNTFIPYLFDQSRTNQADPKRVQPQCRLDLAGVGTTSAPKLLDQLVYAEVPMSRPLCPPGAVAY
jgi:hypothetical protein